MLKRLRSLLSNSDVNLIRDAFDENFYKSTNSDVDFSKIRPLNHFALSGWREGRDPAPWFSIRDYLDANEDVAKAQVNPFLHYLRHGRLEHRPLSKSGSSSKARIPSSAQPRNPNGTQSLIGSLSIKGKPKQEESDLRLVEPAFDERYYRQQNIDVDFSAESPLSHFLRIGWRQGRDPTPWFSIRNYLALHGDVRRSNVNPFIHFLEHGRSEERLLIHKETVNVIPSISPDAVNPEDLALLEAGIDDDFYRRQAQLVDFTVISPALHYAIVGWRVGLDPTPMFSTLYYLGVYEDVRSANLNPFLHYLRQGRAEGRLPKQDSTTPITDDGKTEWLDYEYVRAHGGASCESGTPNLSSLEFTVSLLGSDLDEIVSKLRFHNLGGSSGSPLVSVIIPCLNQQVVTAECLASIERALPNDFAVEIIVVDNASTDPIYAAIERHADIRYIRCSENLGFGPACNKGAEVATGEYLFFLNNDAQIAPGALESLVKVYQISNEREKVGLVGPKLISFDGRLQEAGCLLNPDGTGSLIGFAGDPTSPRFNYQRFVDHVSGAAILIRRALFGELGGFDPIYAPAYCEDADLSLRLRAAGFKIVYNPQAIVAHHLSRTAQEGNSEKKAATEDNRSKRKHDLLVKNRLTLQHRWAHSLSKTALRTIALYLPQYHPIPQNDLWWGKGFTDWSNLTKAKPVYWGQNQPRVPADLGYYDLRASEVLEHQVKLARRYGIYGFCYYYYNFDGVRLLETPLEHMLQTGRPDFPFCLCWANENWTRRWDGHDQEILIKQSYHDEHLLGVIDDLSRYFRSENYIRIDGKPLILIYRVPQLPHPKRALDSWRNHCRARGLGEIVIAMVESFELSPRPKNPRDFGCDITVEFPIHEMVTDNPIAVRKTDRSWTGSVHDYRNLALAFMRREEPGFMRLRSVLVGWDSTPRHPTRSLVLENSSPGAFQAWLEWTYRRTLEQNYGDSRLVFINAWNEWCEGSYLEPDRQFGHGYLQAVRNALTNIEMGGGKFAI